MPLGSIISHRSPGCTTTLASHQMPGLALPGGPSCNGWARFQDLHRHAQPLHRCLGHTQFWGRVQPIASTCPGEAMKTQLPVLGLQQRQGSRQSPGTGPSVLFHGWVPPMMARLFWATLHLYLDKMCLHQMLFNTHNFRIGATTAVTKAGFSPRKMMDLG